MKKSWKDLRESDAVIQIDTELGFINKIKVVKIIKDDKTMKIIFDSREEITLFKFKFDKNFASFNGTSYVYFLNIELFNL